jgi:hypothetical protein
MPGAVPDQKGNAACLAETLLARTVMDARPKLTFDANPLYRRAIGDRGPPYMLCSRPSRLRHVMARDACPGLADVHPHRARTASRGNTGVNRLASLPSSFALISASRMEYRYDNRS